ncbi:MAG: cyclic nucleotide-binding domain-containing protein [Candidatus Electryoneaceae bacterium]|nr:cyclic nucleotide-binding domain-containing protein [Candidatus Electryoneaceae bacterium]
MDKKKELLKASGLTKDMLPEEIESIITLSEEQSFPKGTVILREVESSRDMYVIKSGRVSIRLSIPCAQENDEIILILRDGQIFGEMSLVDGSPRSASVMAEDEVIVYIMDYQKLSELLETTPRIGYIFMRNIASIIASRTRSTNMLWRNLMTW